MLAGLSPLLPFSVSPPPWRFIGSTQSRVLKLVQRSRLRQAMNMLPMMFLAVFGTTDESPSSPLADLE